MPVFALLLIGLVAELAVIIAVGQTIGVLLTILLLVAVSMAGVALLRRQGFRTLMSFNNAIRDRRDPSPEMTDGVLIAVAAGLVMFPGFVSDLAALFLLFPPTRALVRRRLLRRATTRRQVYVVVDGEIVDEPPADAIVIDGRRDD
ncbi:FxsA family protein [Actinophytocola sp.]|uniref:FxsA family protein n=1 Tax=Actinophytocola sp. TaxID=1872138 RepID=UPI002ED2B1E7